jgi:hypothetical protein
MKHRGFALTLLLIFSAQAAAQARLSVANLAALTPFVVGGGSAIQLRINGVVTPTIAFGAVTGYATFNGGETGAYRVELILGGQTIAAAREFSLPGSGNHTIFVTGDAIAAAPDVTVVVDSATPQAGRAAIRLINGVTRTEIAQGATTQAGAAGHKVAVSTPSIAIVRDDGTPIDALLSEVPFKGARTALSIAPGTYNLKVMDATLQRNLDDLEPFTVQPGQSVFLFAGGNDVVQPVVVVGLGGQTVAREVAVDYTFADSWFDVGAARQGLSFYIDPRSDSLSGAWFTYEADGGRQAWLTVSTCESLPTACSQPGAFRQELNRANTLFVYRLAGGAFNRPNAPSDVLLGTATLTFLSCTTARLTWQLAAPFGSGSQNLLRAGRNPIACALAP